MLCILRANMSVHSKHTLLHVETEREWRQKKEKKALWRLNRLAQETVPPLSLLVFTTKQILNQPPSVYLDCKLSLIRLYWVSKWGMFDRNPGSGSSLCNRRLVPYHLGQGWQFSSWTSRSLLGHPHHSTSTVTIVHTNLIKHFHCVLLLGDGEKGKGAKHLTPKNYFSLTDSLFNHYAVSRSANMVNIIINHIYVQTWKSL